MRRVTACVALCAALSGAAGLTPTAGAQERSAALSPASGADFQHASGPAERRIVEARVQERLAQLFPAFGPVVERCAAQQVHLPVTLWACAVSWYPSQGGAYHSLLHVTISLDGRTVHSDKQRLLPGAWRP